ncbi:hypothetical protein LZ31DRAFT_560604, partial [Colletotrichum somersetense]
MPLCDSDDFDFEASQVIVVREDEGQPPEVIEHCFELRVRYSYLGLVSFRLLPAYDGTPVKNTAWLQIRASCVKSLEKMLYDKANTNSPSPPYLEAVRCRLNGMQSVTRLQFHLHTDAHIDLITPPDSDTKNAIVEPVLNTRASLISLATALRFSLYFRHDILRRKTFLKYKRAIRDFPCLTENEKNAYECMVDTRRLYHGAGGKVHRLHDHHGPPSTKENANSPAPATPASCGSTLPFEDVPPDRGSPPPYDECSSEGQSPKARPDAAATDVAAIDAESSRHHYDCGPPEHGDAKRRKNLLDLSQGVFFPLGDTDIHIKPIKRKSPHTTTMSTLDATRPDKLQRALCADAESVLIRMLEQQKQQINDIQQKFEKLEKRNEELEARCDELEKKFGELEDGQCGTAETVGNLDITVDELQARCDTLEKQMPDVCDEMEDLKEKWLEEFRDEFTENKRELSEDTMAKQIREKVEVELDQARGRVLKALQPSWVNQEVEI